MREPDLSIGAGWYGEALPNHAFAVLVRDSHIQTHIGRVELPLPGDNVLYLRCTHVGGFRMAGQSHGGRGTWERAGGQWRVTGTSFGVNPVIYDENGLLNVATESHQGFRYVDLVTFKIWTGDETYADPARRIGEYTTHGDVTIGQSGFSCQALYQGKRYVLARGSCRNIVFNRDGDRCAVTVHIENENRTVLFWFDVSELAEFPEEVPLPPIDPPIDPPDPPTEPPVFTYDTTALNNYAQGRWAALPKVTRRQQQEAFFRILYEFRQLGHPEIEVFRKGQTDTTFPASDGFHYAEDICVIVQPNGKWQKDVGIAFGSSSARLDFGAGWAPPNGNDAANCVPPPLPAGVEEPPDPPATDLTSRVTVLESQTAGLRADLDQLQMTTFNHVTDLIERVTVLEGKPPGGGLSEAQVNALIADALRRTSASGRTASNGGWLGHTHPADLPLVTKP